MAIMFSAEQTECLDDGMQPRRLETSRRAQVLNVAGNQLSGPIPAAWARDPKAANGSVFPDLRVAALLPSAGHSFGIVGNACMNHIFHITCQTDRLCSKANFVIKGHGREEAGSHCCRHA